MLCLLLFVGYYYSYDYTMPRIDPAAVSGNGEEPKADEQVNSMQIVDAAENEPAAGYYICLKGGQIVVYEADRKTIFEYTDIVYDGLPEDLQEEIAEGKYIADQKALYSFLENYSS